MNVKGINYPLLISIGLAIALHHFHGQQSSQSYVWDFRPPSWTQIR